MTVVTVYPKRFVVPDGDPCDRCPRELGQGGRIVRVSKDGLTSLYRYCYWCTSEVRKSADHVIKEV